VVLARPNDLGKDRLGLAVSRKVGGAVVRNRARRLLRESFHRTAVDTAGGYDIVVLAKREIIGRTQAEVDREFEDRIRRLRRGRARPPVTPAASVD